MTQKISDEAWRPIAEYDWINKPIVHLAAYIVPSEYAQQNGNKPHWTYADGRCWTHGDKYRRFTGILGGNPSHFIMEI